MIKGDLISPEQAQDLALQEALKGAGFVSPNPLVGCVIVDKNHRLLSSGYHARLGGDHAEVDALKKISKEELKGATVYVTLEPCAHEGRTPSCAKRLAEEPIAKVVAALIDPDPRVAGKGFSILKEKNIAVEVDKNFGLKALYTAEHFLWHVSQKIPFVALKIASSLDGKMALKNGESKWITGEEARQASRRLRAHYDATMIGAGTLLKDDPLLDFRDTEFAGKKTNRVVIWDPKNRVAEFLPKSKLSKNLPPENIIVINQPNLDRPVLEELYQKGIYSLFVEGGSYAISQFVKNKSYQKLYYFLAPTLLGQGLGWTDHLELASMADKRSLNFREIEMHGRDLLLKAYPVT